MAKFFIDRPIFAWVIAIVIMLAGVLAITTLPVSQYPQIAPPKVQINATYPGASAKTLEDTVTQVIEQRMNGIDGLRYMASTSDSSGTVQITLTFEAGTNPDIAQVQVQNKLQLATALLPQEVQQQGIRVSKASAGFLMVAAFVSTNGTQGRDDLSDYVAANVQDPISRVPGVGDITLFGSQYAMRIWLDPTKLNSYKLTTGDVRTALTSQNAQISVGQLGGAPAVPGTQLNASINAQSRLQTVEQFGNVIMRVNQDGSQVRLRDVARIELGAENYGFDSKFNGQPAAGFAINLATGANALNTASAVKARLKELSEFFPTGMEIRYPYDTTPFVKISIEGVIQTLAEAILLVFLVMYLFLQNFRATLIPTIAVPVVLLGTFGVLAAAGFSINTLTMFGMVLAIGLLVDDAIVVVENVERVMAEEGLSPTEATRKSMGQITGALVGIALVLSAVFVPMAFFGGSVGAIYRQFSITIVSSMALSVVVALTLTPALCATMLKPIPKGHHGAKKGFFGWFNRNFDRATAKYEASVAHILRRGIPYLVMYLVLVGGMVFLFTKLPSSFLPDEDQGILFTQIQLPANASMERTQGVVSQVEKHYMENEKDNVNSIFTVTGFSFAGRGQNMAIGFVSLKDWSQRKTPESKAGGIVGRAMGAFSQIRDASVFAFPPPAIIELGNATGFDFMLQDRAGLGHEALMQARGQLLGLAAQQPGVLSQVRPNGMDDTPQYQVDVDFEKSSALGIAVSDINATLSTAWGGAYINDFIDKGRVKKVYLMADAKFRMLPSDLDRWYVRNNQNEMVPFSAFATGRWVTGSPKLERYNGVSSIQIQGSPAPGASSGQALNAMEALMKELPPGFGFEWTGLSYEERLSGSQAPLLYGISLLVVFLCLAALYESWSIPFSVMLVVPLGVFGALVAATGRGLSNDVYFQVGLLTTIGLSAKNAILIVEFAKDLYEDGKGLTEATLEAVRMRLRPILMTSLAFILGVLPLAISTGAGSGSQNAIGTGVMGGMIAATVLAIFFVPLFFVVILRTFTKAKDRPNHDAPLAAGTKDV
ncbi:efflux RND transporter permease subunit [Pigmentiphaga aceris]|uniref:Efflux pump membrane transporter n=1 Tax=Pigmentiphaga aceris TaxID=1940612 RepID=A0A5C0B5G8_9BURK|nr:efflux RND transporter permease subunit [Pigmentiphaga aceris]QEI08111.1 efflux RND transporter permease subunit [Pigmentiphaga aceris]